MNWIQSNLLREFSLDGRYLVGVSGGRDSVALLHQLLDFGYAKLIVCHLNHKLRGRSSDADAHFVQKLAARWNVDLEIGVDDIRALAKKKKVSIETAAREARYSFFARIAKRRRCRVIFLGHHADDLVETFLINLFRGAGATGLAGMREIATRRLGNLVLTIVRPLLGVWRAEIDKYVHEHRLRFREDLSNEDPAPLRNRFRRKIIPYLERELGRGIRQNIFRTAMILAEEENWIDNQLPNFGDVNLAVGVLRKLPTALQRRQILGWLRARKVGNVGFNVVERVRSLIDPGARMAKVNLPGNRHARRRAKKIFITD